MRPDVETNLQHIYINEFASLENSVAMFYQEMLTSYRTMPEDLTNFMVLINAKNGSIESKTEESNAEEYKEEKILEFKNSVLLEDDDLLKDEEKNKQYKFLTETLNEVQNDIANFMIYEPMRGIKEEEILGKKYFKVENEEENQKNRNKVYVEVEKLLNIRKIILDNRIKADVQAANVHMANNVGLTDSKKTSVILSDFAEKLQEEIKDVIAKYSINYFGKFVKLTGRMDGRTIAAYIRGNGRVISRMDTIVEDSYYWHKEEFTTLNAQIDRIILQHLKFIDEKIKMFMSDEKAAEFREVLLKSCRNKIYNLLDEISKQLINILDSNLVGQSITVWIPVKRLYPSKNVYSDALYEIVNNIFIVNNFKSNVVNVINGSLNKFEII